MQNKEIEKRGGQHQVREDDDQEARASKEIEAWKEDYQEIKRKLSRKTFTMPELWILWPHQCTPAARKLSLHIGAQTLEPKLQAESSLGATGRVMRRRRVGGVGLDKPSLQEARRCTEC